MSPNMYVLLYYIMLFYPALQDLTASGMDRHRYVGQIKFVVKEIK